MKKIFIRIGYIAIIAFIFFVATLGVVIFLQQPDSNKTVLLNIPLSSIQYLNSSGITKSSSVLLTSQGHEAIVLKPNIANLKRLLLKNSDLITVELHLKVTDITGNCKDGKLLLYRMLKNVNSKQQLISNKDYCSEPIAEINIDKTLTGQWVRFTGIKQDVLGYIEGTLDQYGFVVILKGDESSAISLFIDSPKVRTMDLPRMMVEVHSYPKHNLFKSNPVPKEGVYVEIKNGHLFYDNKRLRLWGVSRQRAPYTPNVIARLKAMGFNSIRGWWPWDIYTDDSAKNGLIPAPSYKGDLGAWDQLDRRIVECRDNGIFMVMGALHCNPLGVFRDHEKALLSNDSFLAYGDDWEDWKQGISSGFTFDKAVFFDERMQNIQKIHASNVLTHVNFYTGKRIADEEVIVIWELFNENSFIKRTLDSGFDKWPDYFKHKLQVRWNQWLKQRYKNEKEIIATWGSLSKDEALNNYSISLAPIYSERNNYPKARADDFVRFFIELVNAWQKELENYCRGFSKQGKGIAVVPFWADTQYKHCTPLLYTSTQSEVQSFGMYYWALSSALTAEPAMHIIDSTSVAGKPTVLYETNISRPNPYRAEYPWRLVALASIQDWDGIFWHYWDKPVVPYLLSDEQYLVTRMPQISQQHCWYGIHHEVDPTMCSSIAMAGRVFLNEMIKPAHTPTLFHVPKGKIFGYDGWHGISQKKMVFKYGSHIVLEPDRPGNDVEIEQNNFVADTQIEWDWQNGRMIIDTPTVNAYIGKTCSKFRFSNGVILSDINQPFIVFMMFSADAKPLVGTNSSECIYVSAVKNAWNSGFEFDENIALPNGGFIPPLTQADAIKDEGNAPVISDRVQCRITFPCTLHYNFYKYDLAMRQYESKEINNDTYLEYDGDNMFLGVMQILDRGHNFNVPHITDGSNIPTNALLSKDNVKYIANKTNDTVTVNNGLIYCPVNSINWGLSYDEAYKLLIKSDSEIGAISPKDNSNSLKKIIRLTDTMLSCDSNVDVDIIFENNVPTKIILSLNNQPPILEMVDFYSKYFGTPKSCNISSEAFNASKVIFRKKYKKIKKQLLVTIIEIQGTEQVIFDFSD